MVRKLVHQTLDVRGMHERARRIVHQDPVPGVSLTVQRLQAV